MAKKRDIFGELKAGFEALKGQRESKLTPHTFKVDADSAQSFPPEKWPTRANARTGNSGLEPSGK